MNADTGAPAYASQSAVANLRNGFKVNGVLLAVTHSGARIFRPASAKGAHKTWDEFLCDSAAVSRFEDQGYALVGLFGDGCARAYSIPSLKEIAHAPVNNKLDIKRFSEAIITASGDIFGWTGPSEIAVLNVWGTGQDLYFYLLSPVGVSAYQTHSPRSMDKLFDPEALVPPRPTISNLQWISGTQYVSPADLDLLST